MYKLYILNSQDKLKYCLVQPNRAQYNLAVLQCSVLQPCSYLHHWDKTLCTWTIMQPNMPKSSLVQPVVRTYQGRGVLYQDESGWSRLQQVYQAVPLPDSNRLYQAVLDSISPLATHTIGTNYCVHGQQFVYAREIVLQGHFQAIVQYDLVQPDRAQHSIKEPCTAQHSLLQQKQPIRVQQNLEYCSLICPSLAQSSLQ